MTTAPPAGPILDVLAFTTGEMPPTASYGRRSWCFIPVRADAERFDGRIGNVTLKMQKARGGVGRRIDVDTYAVEFDPNLEPNEHGLAFWFSNLTDPAQEQPYRVVVGGKSGRCTCTAGQCRVPATPDVSEGCKHRDFLLAALAEGVFDDVMPADVLARAAVPPAELRPVAESPVEPPAEPATDFLAIRASIVCPF